MADRDIDQLFRDLRDTMLLLISGGNEEELVNLVVAETSDSSNETQKITDAILDAIVDYVSSLSNGDLRDFAERNFSEQKDVSSLLSELSYKAD